MQIHFWVLHDVDCKIEDTYIQTGRHLYLLKLGAEFPMKTSA